jgi:hypothetical protein
VRWHQNPALIPGAEHGAKTRRCRSGFRGLIMDLIVWTAILIATALVVWALAPYHQRMIDNRDSVAGQETWTKDRLTNKTKRPGAPRPAAS